MAPNGTLFVSGTGSDTSDRAVVRASTDAGSTWFGPVDDYNYGPNYETDYDGGMVADSAGNLYVAGATYYDGHWLVRRSTDGGVTWSLVEDFFPGGFETQPSGITADAAGNVYVAGTVDNGTSAPLRWTVRKGVGGTSFSTVDTFSTTGPSQAQGIYAHPTAGIFAVGSATIPGTKSFWYTTAWVVRRSTDAGSTWSTVDTFQLQSSAEAAAQGVGADALGNLYVVGRARVPSGKGAKATFYNHWIVRKSANGGSSWSTVDTYQLSASGNSQATSFVADSKGNLYVAGRYNTTDWGPNSWIVRENPGGTGSWSTVDNYQYVSAGDAQPFAMAANASGNVFVGGAGSNRWLVRKK